MTDKEKLSIKSEDVKVLFGQLSDKQKGVLLGMLAQDKIDKEKIISKKESIIRDLREKYVRVETEAEMMGYRGKKIHIELPAVGDFEGFKFSYFIPNGSVKISDLGHHRELSEKSYLVKEVYELLHAMTRYMRASGISIDESVDYEGYNTYRDVFRFESGNILKSITGFSELYWLKDSDSTLADSCAMWINYGGNSMFSKHNGGIAKLFLKISD